MVKFSSLFTEFLGFWTYIAILKDNLLILGYLSMIIKTVTNEDMDLFSQTCFAIGSFCSSLNITRYFNYQAKFYLAVKAFTRAIPNVMRYVLSISPIFAGFVFAGCMWFGFFTTYFRDVDATMVTLFSAMHGDNLRIVFDKLYAINDFYKFLGRFYTLIFVSKPLILIIFLPSLVVTIQ